MAEKKDEADRGAAHHLNLTRKIWGLHRWEKLFPRSAGASSAVEKSAAQTIPKCGVAYAGCWKGAHPRETVPMNGDGFSATPAYTGSRLRSIDSRGTCRSSFAKLKPCVRFSDRCVEGLSACVCSVDAFQIPNPNCLFSN